MFKQFIKKVMIFFIPFLFYFNVYADAEYVIKYYYNVDDVEYVVSIKFNENDVDSDVMGYGCVTVSKVNSVSDTGKSEYEPIELAMFNSVGEDFYGFYHYNLYWIFNYFKLNEDGNMKSGIDKLKNDPDLYRPTLFLDKSGRAYLLSPYLDTEYINRTYDLKFNDNNLNNYKTIDNLLEKNEFLSDYNINTKLNISFERSAIDSYDSNDKKNDDNVSYTGGNCEKYSKQLKNLKEKIAGSSSSMGVCSGKSLNAMQSVANIYDLKKNFDRSILEEECSDAVFGTNGYINVISNASSFYYDIYEKEEKGRLICLEMQSEYLAGLSILTSYTSYVENADKSGCELIGKDLIDFINDLFDIAKVISLCVCIFLCILDVYKIVITKEDDISKFKNVLIKRVIALVILFLVPLIVNIITDLVNDRYLKSNPSKCSNVIRK